MAEPGGKHAYIYSVLMATKMKTVLSDFQETEMANAAEAELGEWQPEGRAHAVRTNVGLLPSSESA